MAETTKKLPSRYVTSAKLGGKLLKAMGIPSTGMKSFQLDFPLNGVVTITIERHLTGAEAEGLVATLVDVPQADMTQSF